MRYHKTDFQVQLLHWGVLWSRSSRVFTVTYRWSRCSEMCCEYPASPAPMKERGRHDNPTPHWLPSFFQSQKHSCLYLHNHALLRIYDSLFIRNPPGADLLTHPPSKHTGDSSYLFKRMNCVFSIHVAFSWKHLGTAAAAAAAAAALGQCRKNTTWLYCCWQKESLFKVKIVR